MSIPKIIHYCWFGHNPKPELFDKCFDSWKRKCPDYQIIEWNEENFDIAACPLYVRQAYENKKWAFVTDYVRLKVVYDHGGIYLDTDVELKKRLDRLLKYDAYFGFEEGRYINTGLGFGAVEKHFLLDAMMKDYEKSPFQLENGEFDQTTCPVRNTEVFLKIGLCQNDRKQILDNRILILPTIYMCPIEWETGKMRKSLKTISIHWFTASWMNEMDRKTHELRRNRKREETLDKWIHLPNRVLRKVVGEEVVDQIKKYFRK